MIDDLMKPGNRSMKEEFSSEDMEARVTLHKERLKQVIDSLDAKSVMTMMFCAACKPESGPGINFIQAHLGDDATFTAAVITLVKENKEMMAKGLSALKHMSDQASAADVAEEFINNMTKH